MKRSGSCVECGGQSDGNMLCPECYRQYLIDNAKNEKTRACCECCECMGKDFDSRGRCMGCLHAFAILLDGHHIPAELRKEVGRSLVAWKEFIQTPLDKRWEIIFRDLYDRGLL